MISFIVEPDKQTLRKRNPSCGCQEWGLLKYVRTEDVMYNMIIIISMTNVVYFKVAKRIDPILKLLWYCMSIIFQ